MSLYATNAAKGLTADAYGGYSAQSVETWDAIAKQQAIRDSVYWETLSRYLLPGSVLEIGAACGQVSQLLESYGFDVTASDYYPFFVDHMKSAGLKAIAIDATDIARSTGQKFDNIIAQSLTTQMRRNPEIIEKTYRSIHASLKTGGRFLSTCCLYPVVMYPWNKRQRKLYVSHGDTLRIIERMGVFRVLHLGRYQVLKSSWYTESNKQWLNWIDFSVPRVVPFAAIRGIYVLEKR